jgi:hypothetical protein
MNLEKDIRPRADLGSARILRAGFGVPPKRTSHARMASEKVRERVDAFASTLQACAPQI